MVGGSVPALKGRARLANGQSPPTSARPGPSVLTAVRALRLLRYTLCFLGCAVPVASLLTPSQSSRPQARVAPARTNAEIFG